MKIMANEIRANGRKRKKSSVPKDLLNKNCVMCNGIFWRLAQAFKLWHFRMEFLCFLRNAQRCGKIKFKLLFYSWYY